MPIRAHRKPFGVWAIAVFMTLFVASCGGEMSLGEYAEEVEGVVTSMNAELDAMDETLDSTSSLEEIQQYARDRQALRYGLVEDLEEIDPPARVADLHREALAAVEALTRAEDAVVARVLEADTAEVAGGVWDTPEGIAARQADARTVKLCEAAQDTFDRTQAGEEYEDVPWIPDEMKEVIRVALGCRAEDR